ncbi:Lamin-B receptor [Mycolicibacterium brisbanense]|uniref:Lamin-B receptor n=1 Tax=Mycolicibacterium brisbanense TaxID=146020 RepID=A0A100W6C6_9MYCO|nr:Lamin-B receptor [Mycolicibacterium brisbanense]
MAAAVTDSPDPTDSQNRSRTDSGTAEPGSRNPTEQHLQTQQVLQPPIESEPMFGDRSVCSADELGGLEPERGQWRQHHDRRRRTAVPWLVGGLYRAVVPDA